MPSIAEVLASDAKRSWQEAVALVQEIASELAPEQPVPAHDDLLLGQDGTFSFGFAAESSRPQVTELGELLAALLEGTTAPQPLLDLARENATLDPAHPTLEGFRRALSFYERPNRRSDVAAVASRLAARSQTDHARDIVAQLRQKVAAPEEAADPRTEPPKPGGRRFQPKQISMAAGAVVLVAAAVMGASRLRSGATRGATMAPANPPVASPAAQAPDTPAPSPEDPAGAAPSGATVAPDKTGSAADSVPARTDAAAPAVSSPKSPSATTARQMSGPVRRVETRPGKSGGQRPAGRPPRTPMSTFDMAAVPPLPAGGQGLALATDAFGTSGSLSEGSPVYSHADPDVKPPKLLRQQLPTRPAPNALTGYLDFIVDTQGDVESITLTSPTTRFQDLMLVAAAKAWKFRPAQLAGRPVKYRMRVAITLDGSS